MGYRRDTLTNDDLLTLVRVRELARSGEARKLREAADLSLREVAAAVGTSPASLSRWELGQRRPHGPAAVRYGAILHTLQTAVSA
jgi:DNA-binding transcriptional regulator YiaG